MFKKILLCLLMMFSFCSCSLNNNQGESTYNITFTDASNEEVTINQKPSKVAVLFSSFAQIWVSVGGKVDVTVGDSIKRGFVNDDVLLVNDGAGLKIDNEKLVASSPDLVIVSYDLTAQVEAGNLMRDLGINTLMLKEETFDDYLKILDLFARINENTTAYEELGTNVGSQIDNIKARKRGNSSSYLFIRAGSAFSSTRFRRGINHFGCVIFDELGGVNVADSLNLTTETLSLEAILKADPDKIIVVAQGDEESSRNYITSLFSEEGWNSLSAIKNDKVYFVEKELFNYKPNALWAEAYEKAYNILYEE